jgi:hypothetical protein
MSTEKENLEALLKKIDDLVTTMGKISEELRSVSASIKSIAVSQITVPSTQRSTATPTQAQQKKSTVEDVRMAFPEDLDNLLTFEEKDEYIMIKPRQFLGSENFAKIASAVRGMGGEYISAGKDSHFRVYKKKS